MNKFLISLLILIGHQLSAQVKADFYWPFGKDQDPAPGLQASEFDFNGYPFIKRREGGLSFDRNNSSICDENGNLLFYSNGCAVANRNHELMPNGEGINAGPFFDVIWEGDCKNGYPGRQDVLILPDPGNDQGLSLIHI